MDERLDPLRPLADPAAAFPMKGVDQVCGFFGPIKFAATVMLDGSITCVIGKVNGSRMTEKNVNAFCRRWGVLPEKTIIEGRAAGFEVSTKPKETEEMITPMIDNKGLTAAICQCDVCGQEAKERAKFHHGKTAADRQMDEGQVRQRLQHKGWTYIKGVLRCPTCEQARKPIIEEAIVVQAQPKTEPTREQMRQINAMLEAVYDIDAQRYTGKETDITVAEALGTDFMVEWVASVRDRFYGPEGNNAEVAEIMAEIVEIKSQFDALKARLDDATARLEAVLGVKP